jgi:peptidoglycan/xylan/chitin deacetylase (PgdA/CDA1 family)
MIKRITYFLLVAGIISFLTFLITPSLKNYAIYPAIAFFAGIILLVAGVVKVQWGFFAENFCSIPGSGEEIALTFDDGPHEETERLLDILDRYNAKATFFCIGTEVEKYPEIMKRIIQSGHSVGSHTYSHYWKFTLSNYKHVNFEISRGTEAIEKITGKKTVLFRPPYGITNPIIGKSIKKNKLMSIGWNIRTFDTTKKDAGEIFRKLANELKPGAVILMHDRLKITVDAVPQILEEIKKRGLIPVTIEKALKNKPNA